MSFAALAMASKYRAKSAAIKLVLLAYADRHNEEDGCAYPSLAWLEEFTSLNRKTIIAAVMSLEADGILSDTGERRGSTRQIKVYRVSFETVPKTEPYQKRNSTKNGGKQSQKRDTDTIREPISQKASPSSRARAKNDNPAKPETYLPDGWRPAKLDRSTVAGEIVERRGQEWARRTMERFENHWRTKSGKAARKSDWQRTWANWVIEQDDRDGRNGYRNTGRQSAVGGDGFMSALNEISPRQAH